MTSPIITGATADSVSMAKGRAPSGQALAVPATPAEAVDGPAGFDPSRFKPDSYEGKPRHIGKAERKELEALLKAARQHFEGLTPWRQQMLFKAFLDISPINCSWQHYALAETFIWEVAAIATEARRAETTGSACEGAGPKDIAQ